MSKNLEHWLEWATTETHVPVEERAERGCALAGGDTDTDWSIIVDCAAHVAARALGSDFDTSEADIAYCLTSHPEAFRDLCLALHRAIEAMHQVVPEAVVEPVLMMEGWRVPDPGRGIQSEQVRKIELGPSFAQTREDADRCRGITDTEWVITGDRDWWYPWDVLLYLVVDVLTPGRGNTVRAEDERLMRMPWWPKPALTPAQ